jgi:excisionase family DNA binding protein
VQARLTYTVPEVAELLGISRSTAYECVRRGEIPALTLGRRVVIAKATIDAMLGPTTNDLQAPTIGEAHG